jgi:DNA-binding CsgD family transcriptional regulator
MDEANLVRIAGSSQRGSAFFHNFYVSKNFLAKLFLALTVVMGCAWSLAKNKRMKTKSKFFRLFFALLFPEKADYNLTPHETRLLKMLVDGHNYTTAAEFLGVSYTTVSFHMRSLYDKLQVHSKSEAVAKALQQGLIDSIKRV